MPLIFVVLAETGATALEVAKTFNQLDMAEISVDFCSRVGSLGEGVAALRMATNHQVVTTTCSVANFGRGGIDRRKRLWADLPS